MIEFDFGGNDGNNLEKIFKKIKDITGRSGENRIVKKTIPATAEWKKKHETMTALADMLSTETKRLNNLRDSFWSEICLKLNDFSDMRFNTKTKEIEILADIDDDDDTGLVKSPYIGK